MAKDSPVVVGALVLFVLVPLFLGWVLREGSLLWLQEGYAGNIVPIAASDLQGLTETPDHAGEPFVLPIGTKCCRLESRPCAACKSSEASRIVVLEGDRMGKLLWVRSDTVRPVYATL